TRSAGKSTQGSKSRQASASESATVQEPMQTTFQMEEPSHPEFETTADDQPIVQSSQHPEWFSQQKKPPTLNRDWNKTLQATHGSTQPWISKLAKQSDSRSSFNELMDTPGSCKSMVELEFLLEEVYKATTDQLDWVNPEESLKKYGFESCDPVDTPMVEKSKLDEDKKGKAIDLSHYRGMIGTLLYLTASRPDLQFAICMCARQ
nr:uncharacterized mitochondrial protein AtMg00810-like [Tanacetum cinerariifolium]